MSRSLSEDICTSVKELITVISGFQENTEQFNHLFKYFINKLKRSDTMYFSSKRDIDQNIYSMTEKFCFHGFFRQAEALKTSYKSYVAESLPKPEIMNRLNMTKFLLSMSQAPTKHFLENPEMIIQEPIELVEEINWTEYLKEGIDTWNPNFEETSDDESYGSYDESGNKDIEIVSSSVSIIPLQIRSSDKMYVMDFKANREELLHTIQHSWYNEGKFFLKPDSQLREANMGILWENFLQEQAHGLVDLRRPSFTTEYKVIREILWQLWCPHTCTTIELIGDSIRAKPDITLPSVRSMLCDNISAKELYNQDDLNNEIAPATENRKIMNVMTENNQTRNLINKLSPENRNIKNIISDKSAACCRCRRTGRCCRCYQSMY